MTLLDADGREIQQPDIHDPQNVSPEDAELLARMVEEMRALEEAEPMVVAFSPLSVVQLAGLLQLALRHEGTAGDIRATALRFLDGAREYFAEAPATLEIIARGFHSAYDRPRDSVRAYCAHLDTCAQCRDSPLEHYCAEGYRLLRAVVDGGDRL